MYYDILFHMKNSLPRHKNWRNIINGYVEKSGPRTRDQRLTCTIEIMNFKFCDVRIKFCIIKKGDLDTLKVSNLLQNNL